MGIGKNFVPADPKRKSCMQPQVMVLSQSQPNDKATAPGDPMIQAAVRQCEPVHPPVRAIGEPFRTAEEAWFWAFSSIAARHQGTRSRSGNARPRPCDPDDVMKCLDALYRRRRIDLTHARILQIWGERGAAPNTAYASERCDAKLWREALERLEWPLRVKGIVAG